MKEAEHFHISRFIRLRGNNVLMRRPDGLSVWIPLTELSVGDRFLVLRRHEKAERRQPPSPDQKKRHK